MIDLGAEAEGVRLVSGSELGGVIKEEEGMEKDGGRTREGDAWVPFAMGLSVGIPSSG